MEINRSGLINSTLKDKIRGCLLGVAIGDALGAPFEHVLPGQTNQTMDQTGGRIEDFHPYWTYPAGSWTDDTGMTLATCHAFIEMATTSKNMEDCFREAFKTWSVSQECRRPGKTVLYAAKFGKSDDNSWANGALMRISPVAIYSYLIELSMHETAALAYKIARLTHGHTLATFPAVSCVQAISSILHGEEKVPYFAYSGTECGEAVLTDPASRIILYNSEYVRKYIFPIEDLPVTTGLWMWRHVIENCMGLKPKEIWTYEDDEFYWADLPDFESGILHTVNNSFDRDTAGAVAGAILGTYWGESGIPDRWKNRVEKADVIRELADKLMEVCHPDKSEQSLDKVKQAKHNDRAPEPIGLLMKDVTYFAIGDETYVNANPPETLKEQYEKRQGISPESGWEILTWEDRYTLKRGDTVRGYIRPYAVPEEIYFQEYRIKSAPHITTSTNFRYVRGIRSEVVDVYGNMCCATYKIFDHAEVWIKRV